MALELESTFSSGKWKEFDNFLTDPLLEIRPKSIDKLPGLLQSKIIFKIGSGIHVYPVTIFSIKKVIFNDPATIVLWEDGTKTVVKCQGEDLYDREKGLALCFMKKALGNKGNFNNVFRKEIDNYE